MAEKISQLPAASALDGTESVPVVQAGATAQAAAGAFLPPDYISGLKMVWNSANSLSVTSGAAFVESLGRVMRSSATLTLSGLSLAASTWYHVYLYNNGGTPAIECVTTAPDAPYFGTARAKTGDTSRRYIGGVLTDASANIINFKHYRDVVRYLSNSFIVVGSGTATSPTTVSCSSFVPPTGVSFYFRAIADSSANLALETSDAPGVALLQVSAGTNVYVEFPLDAAQEFQYFNQSTPAGGATIAGFSYTYER